MTIFIVTGILFLLVSGAIANVLGFALLPPYMRVLKGFTPGMVAWRIFWSLFLAFTIWWLALPHGSL